MADIGRFNRLQIVKHTGFGLYLNGGNDGDILLPNRYIPKDEPTEVGDWLNVFIYFDSEDKIIATTEQPKAQVGDFASLKVVAKNNVGLFLDWGLPKDVLLPYSEQKKPLEEGSYVVVHLYLDKHTSRVIATSRLDRYLDKTPARYKAGEQVELLVVERTDLGHKAIINGLHWGLIHKNEAFKYLRGGQHETGYIREMRADGKISLSLSALPLAINCRIRSYRSCWTTTVPWHSATKARQKRSAACLASARVTSRKPSAVCSNRKKSAFTAIISNCFEPQAAR